RIERPVAVPPEVVEHGTDPRAGRRAAVVQAELQQDRVDREVHDVPARAHHPEAHQLVPVVAPAHAVPYATVHRPGCAHPGQSIPKADEQRGATSWMPQAWRSGASTPQNSNAPSESLWCSDPCEPPPTGSTPPQ